MNKKRQDQFDPAFSFLLMITRPLVGRLPAMPVHDDAGRIEEEHVDGSGDADDQADGLNFESKDIGGVQGNDYRPSRPYHLGE